MYSIDYLRSCDPEVASAIDGELARQRRNIELIASENIVSEAVLAAAGSILTNKYAEGYPGKRYYGGCGEVDKVEEIARERACRLFGAEHANVQPHSGASANLAVFFALCHRKEFQVCPPASVPRFAGQYLRQVLPYRPVRRFGRDPAHRLRRNGAHRAGLQAEDDRRRRLRLRPHHRFPPLSGDRR